VPLVNEKNFYKNPLPWWRSLQLILGVMKITHNVALSFHHIVMPLNQFIGAILDYEE